LHLSINVYIPDDILPLAVSELQNGYFRQKSFTTISTFFTNTPPPSNPFNTKSQQPNYISKEFVGLSPNNNFQDNKAILHSLLSDLYNNKNDVPNIDSIIGLSFTRDERGHITDQAFVVFNNDKDCKTFNDLNYTAIFLPNPKILIVNATDEDVSTRVPYVSLGAKHGLLCHWHLASDPPTSFSLSGKPNEPLWTNGLRRNCNDMSAISHLKVSTLPGGKLYIHTNIPFLNNADLLIKTKPNELFPLYISSPDGQRRCEDSLLFDTVVRVTKALQPDAIAIRRALVGAWPGANKRKVAPSSFSPKESSPTSKKANSARTTSPPKIITKTVSPGSDQTLPSVKVSTDLPPTPNSPSQSTTPPTLQKEIVPEIVVNMDVSNTFDTDYPPLQNSFSTITRQKRKKSEDLTGSDKDDESINDVKENASSPSTAMTPTYKDENPFTMLKQAFNNDDEEV
jgi:hypothetical protein